ncbi:hypothetical protein M3I54_07345 [Paraburkholderia sp. CNPSo 3274]|uniref:hypothetical protein n=1 Tax=Paraburkholderia sp. CNPSo 3274 TaxID=2940932 RepID=UPI0020B85DFB|nr:hypothetical protein [Paraburkholderia sp. CNPSo 3274]MCP3706802.1 hypothetical protein [Paraburkholderia sp. CNPSo 3274]
MLLQKFHPGSRLGQQLTLAHGGTLFSRQGHWDGGSTLHYVAMALALLGKLSDPVDVPYHVSGNERVVWDHAWPHYLHGLTLSELESFVWELNLGVQPVVRAGPAPAILRFTSRELAAGRPVIIGWRQRHPVKWRAALAVGMEGRLQGRTFEPHALLMLDPAGSEPRLAGFNARIDLHGNGRARYQSQAVRLAVTLEGVVSIRTPVSAGGYV